MAALGELQEALRLASFIPDSQVDPSNLIERVVPEMGRKKGRDLFVSIS